MQGLNWSFFCIAEHADFFFNIVAHYRVAWRLNAEFSDAVSFMGFFTACFGETFNLGRIVPAELPHGIGIHGESQKGRMSKISEVRMKLLYLSLLA